jgi:amidase
VTDAAALLDAIDTAAVDYVAGLRTDALDGVTVGMLNKDIAADPDNTPLLQAASATLTALGARLRPAALTDTPAWSKGESFMTYLSAGIRYDMMSYVAAHSSAARTVEGLVAYNAAQANRRIPFGQGLLEGLVPLSASMSRADFAALTARLRQGAAEILDETFRRTGADVLVSFESTHSQYYATAGYPAITVPLGLRARGGEMKPLGLSSVGLPVGIVFIGKAGDDARLLAFAYAFEQATNLRVQPVLR